MNVLINYEGTMNLSRRAVLASVAAVPLLSVNSLSIPSLSKPWPGVDVLDKGLIPNYDTYGNKFLTRTLLIQTKDGSLASYSVTDQSWLTPCTLEAQQAYIKQEIALYTEGMRYRWHERYGSPLLD